MIYTVTLNPAVDYFLEADEICAGKVNRVKNERIRFGGKGINVSRVLSELGQKSVALGFVAGFTGDAIEKELKKRGIKTDFVHLLSGFSRINVKISGNETTELNANGPDVTEAEVSKLLEKTERIKNGDILILSGSIPPSVPVNIYEDILNKVKNKNVKTVIDAGGKLLKCTLKHKPFLIKPNIHELEELFNVKISEIEAVKKYAEILHKESCGNVLVSMGKDGAVLVDENGDFHSIKAHKGEVKSAVGSGDSMVAGFIAGSFSKDYKTALRLANAAGGATAFTDGLATKDDIFRLFI